MLKLIVWGLAIFGGVTLVQKVLERRRLQSEDRSPEMFEEAVIIAVEPDTDFEAALADQEAEQQRQQGTQAEGQPAGEVRSP
jgi:hypothetical protein